MSRKKLKDPVLAEGELTGHSHRLPNTVCVFEIDEDTREFENEKEVNLTHEEHKTIAFPPGEWESGIVIEQDPFEDSIRKVRD